MKIKVTQQHIDHGSHASFSCPVSLAIIEATGQEMVGSCEEYIVWGNCKTQLPAPKEVAEFINIFDTKGRTQVSPFEFDLKGIPCVSQ